MEKYKNKNCIVCRIGEKGEVCVDLCDMLKVCDVRDEIISKIEETKTLK